MLMLLTAAAFASPVVLLLEPYQTTMVYRLLQLSMPLLLCVIAISPRRRILDPASLVWLASIALLVFAVWAVPNTEQAPRLLQPLFTLQLLPFLPPQLLPQALPQISIAMALFGLLCVILVESTYHRDPSLSLAWICAYAAVCLALITLETPARAILWFTAAGAVLAVGLIQHAHRMAFIDALTRIPNRRALDEQLSRLRSRYAIAMVDIDHFKAFNDTHGHKMGDQALRKTASHLREVDGGGKVFRYGGEEFTILFPGKTAREAGRHCQALRERIAGEPFFFRGSNRPRKLRKAEKHRRRPTRKREASDSLQITVSIGVAAQGDRASTSARVLQLADQALYHAKKNGRNRVIVARDDAPR